MSQGLTAVATTVDVSAGVDVEELQQGEEGRWDDFVLGASSGTFFHLTPWRRIIHEFWAGSAPIW